MGHHGYQPASTNPAWNGPPTYQVYVTVTPTKKNGVTQPFTGRIGTTNDPAKIKSIIQEDLRAMGDTMGGLIEPGHTSGRTYRAFKAEWTEINLAEIK